MLLELAWSFAKVGLLSFGGGYAMIPLIQNELLGFGIRGKEFVDIVAVSQITPGPVGINSSTFAGFKAAGLPGAMVATFFCAFPTFILMVAFSRMLKKWRKNQAVNDFLKGMRPFFVGLILGSVLIMAREIHLVNDIRALAIFAGTALGALVFKVNPAALILIAGLVGFVVY